MDNYIYKEYQFRDYEIYVATIVSAADDFFQVYCVYPSILAANQLTFDRIAEFMFPPDEYIEDSGYEADNDDADSDDWKKIGGVYPKLKDTGEVMGGYICNDFGVAFHLDEEIGNGEFELRYIEWEVPEFHYQQTSPDGIL